MTPRWMRTRRLKEYRARRVPLRWILGSSLADVDPKPYLVSPGVLWELPQPVGPRAQPRRPLASRRRLQRFKLVQRGHLPSRLDPWTVAP